LISQQPKAEFPQVDSGLAVPSFLPGDDPITCLNKAMAFMSTVMASRFPSTNNQLRTSSNPRNQATIQDGRAVTQLKRPRNSAWFKEKILLVQAQEYGQVLDDEQLAFLADPVIAEGQVTHTTIPQHVAFQTDDLDAYDSDCDDISLAKVVLMANLSSYDSGVLFEKEVFLDNDRLLEHIICQDVMNIVMHADVVSALVFLVNNRKCLVHDNLEIERLE
ncbi:hypothetical protein Tco_1444640, partial [Tanacetum coccineum]